MTNEAVKYSGTLVKELLEMAVGGIYLSKSNWHNAITDFFPQKEFCSYGGRVTD